MSSQTTKLKLTLPATSDIVDASIIANNFVKIDNLIAFAPVASPSDIAEPFEGLKAIDANGATYIYITGDGWVNIGAAPVNGARGRKGVTTLTSDSTSGFGSTETMTELKTTFTAETGRRYWIEASGAMLIAGSSSLSGSDHNIRWATGSSVSVSSTALYSSPYRIRRPHMANLPSSFYFLGELIPNVNGSVTVGLTVSNVYDADLVYINASTTSPAILTVRDVGPS